MPILKRSSCLSIAEHNQSSKFSIVSRAMKIKNDKNLIYNFKFKFLKPLVHLRPSIGLHDQLQDWDARLESLATHPNLWKNFEILEI